MNTKFLLSQYVYLWSEFFNIPMLISVPITASLIYVKKFTPEELKQEYYGLLSSMGKMDALIPFQSNTSHRNEAIVFIIMV